VLAVRRGESLRQVGSRFGVDHRTVHFWVLRARGHRLDRVAWGDRPDGPRAPANRTSRALERAVLNVRRHLQVESALGEHGREAIRRELLARGSGSPSVRTIDRILRRNGVFDGTPRRRFPAPPRGWYLPAVASAQCELDSFDVIEDLKIEGGPLLEVLTGVSLHGGLALACAHENLRSGLIEEALVGFWREYGLPAYSQFDNDTRFYGAHGKPDRLGCVVRRCLGLGVTPVFAPPRETGFQASIEAFNGRWQRTVWRRFHHRDIAALSKRSQAFLQALQIRLAPRIETAPARRPLPREIPSLDSALRGTLIFLRRTGPDGTASLLGRTFPVSRHWAHRLVRAELDIDRNLMRFFALRRREPADQSVLREVPYRLAHKGPRWVG
jgi:hypothetical protein